jgi:hypothetical protein
MRGAPDGHDVSCPYSNRVRSRSWMRTVGLFFAEDAHGLGAGGAMGGDKGRGGGDR